jgi:hypothetical protein
MLPLIPSRSGKMVRIPLFKDAIGTEMGEIIIDKENIMAHIGTSKINVPLMYLEGVELVDRGQLGKIKARIIIYDFLGNKNVIETLLSESNYFTLRGFCRKK